MKVIYHCFGGTHSSVLCAALHLGLISKQKLPTYRDLISLPYFDKVSGEQVGQIFPMGEDDGGNDIYIMGCRSCGPIVEKATKEMNRLLGISEPEILMFDTTPCLNIIIKIGGFLSRRLGLTRLGRPFLYLGIRLAFPKFVELSDAVQTFPTLTGREHI